jgi:hypothetical protein
MAVTMVAPIDPSNIRAGALFPAPDAADANVAPRFVTGDTCRTRLETRGLEKPGINALASQEAARYKGPRPRAFPGPFLRPALDFKGLA